MQSMLVFAQRGPVRDWNAISWMPLIVVACVSAILVGFVLLYRPWRRRIKYSLRTMLIVCLCFGAWLGWQANQFFLRRAVKAQIETNGGRFQEHPFGGYTGPAFIVIRNPDRDAEISTVRKLLGDRNFAIIWLRMPTQQAVDSLAVFSEALIVCDYGPEKEEAIQLRNAIEPPRVTRIKVKPELAFCWIGEKIQFTYEAVSQYGESTRPRDVKWAATGGSIDAEGLFTPGIAEGEFEVTLLVAGVEGRAEVMIKERPLIPIDAGTVDLP